MKECKQIPTADKPRHLGERTTPHENKNLTNKQNSVEKIFWLTLGNNSKPLSSTFQKNKNNPRVRWESP
jgi:hypothetical protein